jgi:hypothetical protein
MWLCVIAVIGCGTGVDATSPSAVSRQMVQGPSFSRAGHEEHVTGDIQIILPYYNNALERYSVSAIRHADGEVSGEFNEFSAQDGGQRVHARIYCFTIVGNMARLAAQIEQTSVPFGPKGSYVVWTVFDNGQGRRSAPDQSTDIFFGASQAIAEQHCRVGYNLAPYFSSVRGNLQVD